MTSSTLQEKPTAGWTLVRGSAAAGFVLAIAGAAVSLPADPALAVPVGLFLGGLAALRGLVAYGAWHRARWSLWLGGVLAVLLVLYATAALVLVGVLKAMGAAVQLGLPPLQLAAAGGQVLANGAFLVGLFILRAERAGQKKSAG